MPSRGPAPAEPAPLADLAGAADRSGLDARPALVVALAGLALVLTGFAVAGPTVAVPGAGLMLLGGLSRLWVLGLTARLDVEMWAPSRTVVEGQPLGIEIVVRGSRLLGNSGAVLTHELLDAPVRLQRAGRLVLDARARGRGQLAIAPAQLSLSDPLGLAREQRQARSRVGRLLVLPRIEPVRWLDAGMVGTGAGAPAGLLAGPPTIDIAGLREYQPGTPATRIHWPAVARGGELLERVFVTETEQAPLLALDLRCADPGADRGLTDLVVRAAASLTVALAHTGSVDLLLPGRVSALRITDSLAAWPAALEALALVPAAELSSAPPRVPAGAEGILFYVCADPGLAAAAQHRWAGRMLTVAPPFPHGGDPNERPTASVLPGGPGGAAVLEVAGCVARPVWGRR